MSNFIHGDNLSHKFIKYKNDTHNMKLLKEIKRKYDQWKNANLTITSITKKDIDAKIRGHNTYLFLFFQPALFLNFKVLCFG